MIANYEIGSLIQDLSLTKIFEKSAFSDINFELFENNILKEKCEKMIDFELSKFFKRKNYSHFSNTHAHRPQHAEFW